MAQIITYPKLSTLANQDLLLISDVSSKNKNTNSVELQTLASFITTSTSGITGSGTLNTIAMFTPDGQKIGDSVITQSYDFLNYTVSVNGILEVGETTISDGSIFTALIGVNNITAGNAGNVSLLGGVIIGNEATDILQITSSVSDYTGTASTAAGQVLVSNASSQLEWTDIADISGSVTGSGTTNTLPVWTDGPNGVLSDSMITQNSSGTIANVTGRLAVDTDLAVNGYARFSGQVQDGTNSPGTNGQVLTSNVSGVEWNDATDVVSGAVAKLIPFNVTASPGGSSVYNADNNIVEISWTTGNGIYVLILPTATGSNAYRNIRFVTNGTFPGGASHKIEITALPGETVDGAAFFEISKTYEGVSLWSNGTEWIVIQAKAH